MKYLPSFVSISAVILVSTLLISCGGGGGGGSSSETMTSSKYASLSISLETATAAKAAAGSVQLPDDITRCVVTCSGPGMTVISADLPLDGSTIVMSNIPPGNNRIVAINAYNGQLLRMSGSHTIASLQAGTTTSVTIQLTDVAVMIISLDPIADMASATDTDYAQIYPSSSLQLYCGVSNHVDTSVTWHVDGIENGSSGVGTISSSGLYSAPTTIGNHTIEAVSNEDPTLTDSITIAVTTAPPDNIPPTANAGTDRTVLEGTNINLVGSGSTDSDGTISSYHWSQTVGTTVTLTDVNSADPLFIAPNISTAETLTFELTVTDDDGATDSDSVSIIVQPSGGSFTVSPKIVHVFSSQSQQFTTTNPSNWWEVNGLEGGSNEYGRIDQSGYYDAPNPSVFPLDVTIEAVETDNIDHTDTAKLAVVQDSSWQKNLQRNGYDLSNSVTIGLGQIIGPYPYFSNITGGLTNTSTDDKYLFFDVIGDTDDIDPGSNLSFSLMESTWDNTRLTAIRTSPYGYDDEFLVVTENSLPSGLLNKAIGVVRANRLGNILWAYQYETGHLTSNYPCTFSRYPFDGAASNTSSNGFILGFSYYYNDECNVSFSQNIHFHVIDQDGTLSQSITIDPNYQPGTDLYTAEMYVVGIEQTSDGGYLAVVNVNVRPRFSTTHISAAPILVKLDSTYNLSWIRQLSQSMQILHIAPGAEDQFYLHSAIDIVLINANGAILSQRQLSSASNTGRSIDQVFYNQTDGGLLIAGSWENPATLNYHTTLIKTANDNSVEWQHTYGSRIEQISSIYARGGSFYLSGKGQGEGRVTVLRVPEDTGLLSNVSENFPLSPDLTLSPSTPPITTTDITAGSTYDIVLVSEIEVNQLHPSPVAIPPEIIPHAISSNILTIAIAKSPDSPYIGAYGEQIHFHASLSHLVTHTAVTWSVNGIEGGNTTVGTISADGMYTSPDNVPDPATVLIGATSVEEPSLSAEITLTIQPGGS